MLDSFALCLSRLYPAEQVEAAAAGGPTEGRPRLFDVSETPHPDGEFYAVVNGRPTIFPHPKQRKVTESSARFVLALAGVRSGKTSAGPWVMCNWMQDGGPGPYLLVAPTFTLLDKAAVPEVRTVLGRILGLGEVIGGSNGYFRISDEGHRKLWPDLPLPHEPSRIIFGYAERPESLAAVTAKGAWLDECGQKGFKQESYEELLARVSIHRGRILFTTRPYLLHWLKTEVYDRAVRNAKGVGLPADADYEVISYESRDNPKFPPEEWERAKATLPDWKFDMLYRGIFTRPAGAVYDCWDPETMVGPAFNPDPSWTRYVGIDFGAPNFAGVFIAEEPGVELAGPPARGKPKLTTPSVFHVYGEYRPNEARSAKEHVEAMKALRRRIEGETPPPIRATIGGSRSENQWRLDFASAGWPIHPPDQTEVEVGIGRTYAFIKTGRLRVCENCPALISDLNTYSRPVDDAGNVLEGIEDKELAHSADALRYVAGWLGRLGPNHYFEVVRAPAAAPGGDPWG